MVTGTYTGDGSSVTLTFPAVPKLILINAKYTTGTPPRTTTYLLDGRIQGGVWVIGHFIAASKQYFTHSEVCYSAGRITMSTSMTLSNQYFNLNGAEYTYTAFF